MFEELIVWIHSFSVSVKTCCLTGLTFESFSVFWEQYNVVIIIVIFDLCMVGAHSSVSY